AAARRRDVRDPRRGARLRARADRGPDGFGGARLRMNDARSATRLSAAGIGFASGCYLLWGIVPVYWKLVAAVPAFEMLIARILWTLLLVLGIALISRRRRELRGARLTDWGWSLVAAS